ncbi:MAG: adenylate/guanylate cyclase domain-containing protein [Mycobacteriales bacterium]|nr:adenylate/guanylate cyclase domain-containing protein [Mycobacteriales bacterium]
MGGSCRRCGGRSTQQAARFCATCGTALLEPAVVRKTVTVLFTDADGLAILAERLDTEVVRRITTELHGALRVILEEHGGTLEKYAGDAVMAVFGVPVSREDDAQRAASAALAVADRLAPLLDQLSDRTGVRLALRTALNTGEVLTQPDSEQGLVLGDAVVVAARLQQQAGPGEVLLGPDTAQLLRSVVRTGEPRELVLRGRTAAVRAHPLLAVRQGHRRVRRTSLVGRSSERALLAATVERTVRGGTAHLVTVLGEAGLGKSRLVDDFLDEQAVAGVLTRRVRTRAYGARVRWSPLPQLLEGLPVDHLPADARSVLAALADEGTGLTVSEVSWALALQTRWLASQAPCVIVLEDLHGAEPEVLEVVQNVVRRLDDAPVVVLATARPTLRDACPAWGAGLRQSLSLCLPPMGAADARRHAVLLLAPATAPSEVVDLVLEAAGGNPLYLEQLVSVLIESGRLVREGQRWELHGDPRSLDLPPTVAALLAARLDRLPPAERHVLERGALLGKDFAMADVAGLVDTGLREDLDGLLDALVRRDLLLGAGTTRSFPSSLVREAAYAGLPRAERARLHEQVGRRLAAEPGRDELAGGHLEEAVRHLSEIGVDATALRDDAADLLGRAGRRALTGDARAAVSLLGRACALLPDDDVRRLLLVPDLARVRALTGDLAGAEEQLRDVLERARAGGHDTAVAHARIALMDLLRSTRPEGAVDLVPALVDEVVPVLRAAGDDHGLSLVHQLEAGALQYRVRWAAMQEPLDRALLHARRANDQRLRELAESLLVGSLFHGPTHAGEVRRRLQRMADEPGISRPHRASVQARLAGTLALQGEVPAALHTLDEVVEVFRSLGRDLSAAATAFMRGPVLLLADDPQGAAAVLEQSCEVLASMGDRAYRSTLLALLAEARWRCGDPDGAQAAVDACRRVGSEGDVISELRWRAVQSKLAARQGDAVRALCLADDAVRLAARTDEVTSQGDVLADRAETRALLGDLEGAQADLRDAIDRYERKGAVLAVRRLAPRVVVTDLPAQVAADAEPVPG